MLASTEQLRIVTCSAGKLHVQFDAALKPAEIIALFGEVARLGRENGASRLLLDASGYRGRVSLVLRVQMALAVVTWFRGFKVAGVLSEQAIDPQRIGQTMARNRGANLMVFVGLAEAEAWLDT